MHSFRSYGILYLTEKKGNNTLVNIELQVKIYRKHTLRLSLVGRKTFSRKTVFLYFQFYIVWLAKECKTIFPWGKIALPIMENHFPFKMKGKLFSLFLLYTPLTTSLLSLSFSFHFIIFLTSNQTTENYF